MYSIFNTKTKKCNHLEEGEPPPKKLITEEDIVIKKLAEKQLKTKLTLTEQLSNKKEFISSETFTNVTSYISGKRGLKEFKSTVADVHELNNLKGKGLSDQDIEIYKDYVTLKSEFWIKYKNINEDVLYRRINGIKELLSSTDELGFRDTLGSTATNEMEIKKYFHGPLDELSNLEKLFMDNIEEYSSCDIKKIRKKARSMGKKIRNLEENGNLVGIDEGKQRVIKEKITQRDTQWDVKEKPNNLQKKQVEIISKDKIYGCKPENWYTIKSGKVIKVDKAKTIPKIEKKNNNTEKSKLTLEDIKNIPKFSNYDPGLPSKVLFLKNLKKNITENCLRNLLIGFEAQCFSVKIMSGKMVGQAFVEFENVTQASMALESLNGVVLNGKPIIVVYGKKKT